MSQSSTNFDDGTFPFDLEYNILDDIFEFAFPTVIGENSNIVEFPIFVNSLTKELTSNQELGLGEANDDLINEIDP